MTRVFLSFANTCSFSKITLIKEILDGNTKSPHMSSCKSTTKPLIDMSVFKLCFQSLSQPPFAHCVSSSQAIQITPVQSLFEMPFLVSHRFHYYGFQLISFVIIPHPAFKAKSHFAKMTPKLVLQRIPSIYKQTLKRNLWFNVRIHERVWLHYLFLGSISVILLKRLKIELSLDFSFFNSIMMGLEELTWACSKIV